MESREQEENETAPRELVSWKGGCACGEVRYVYEGALVLSLKCHCLDCQAWSGAGHLAMAWVWRDGFTITAGKPRYFATRAEDSGMLVKRGSCNSCGAAVAVDIDLIPNVVGIIASSLDTPESFMPEFELWTCRAHPWDPPHPSLRQFESGFDRDVIVPRLRR